MSLAGISGAGVISALGRNIEETRTALYADDPVLPQLTRRLETKLQLPVFEIPVPEADSNLGLPMRFLLTALAEALKNASLKLEMLKQRRVGIAVGTRSVKWTQDNAFKNFCYGNNPPTYSF